MDKYTERILDEIYIVLENHYTNHEDRNDFLNDVLKAVFRIQDNLEAYVEDDE